jgi:F-type H+-transporting ATPase subunit delta
LRAGATAKRYARAVFSLGVETGDFERIGEEIKGIASAMEVEPALREILTNPLYDASSRHEVVSGLAEKKGLSAITRNFLHLLVDKGRFSLLTEISGCYQELSDERAGRMKATVITASKVSDALLGELTASLEKKTGRKVSVESEADPSLIGGIVVKVGDVIYDGSLRTQIQILKDNIRKAA